MNKKNKEIKKEKEDERTLVFLERTKQGKYAPIENSACPYVRTEIEREDIEEPYLFGWY